MTINDTAVCAEDLPDLVATIYRAALQDDSLDENSDFFEAGGDSMAAFEITARLSEALSIDVPVALVFAYPTPVDLASIVDLDRVAS